MEGLKQLERHPRLGNYEKEDLENLVHLQCDEIGRLRKKVEQMEDIIERLKPNIRMHVCSCERNGDLMMM